MKNPIKILSLVCIVAMLSSCAPTPDKSVLTAAATFVPMTPTVASATLQPTASPTIKPFPPFLQYLSTHTNVKCASVVSTTLPHAGISGILAVSLQDKDNYYYVSLLNLENGDNRQLLQKSEVSSSSAFVSPDGKKLAYDKWIPGDSASHKLVILSLSGEFDKTLPWSEKWISLSGWLDNDRLLFLENLTHTVDVLFTGDTLFVLDPFTGKAKEIPATFPDLYNLNSVEWENGIITLYNADLTRVVYPNLSGGLTLLDATNGETIQNITPALQYETPKWSPDGNEFVFSNAITWDPPQIIGNDLFLVNRDGEIKKLTNFVNAPPGMSIDRYSWSPDGKLVAFWIIGSVDEGWYLNVVDLQTGKITNTCITTKYYESSAPVWSFDGEQLAFQIHTENSPDNSSRNGQLVVLNLKANLAIQLNEYFRPIGWMNK